MEFRTIMNIKNVILGLCLIGKVYFAIAQDQKEGHNEYTAVIACLKEAKVTQDGTFFMFFEFWHLYFNWCNLFFRISRFIREERHTCEVYWCLLFEKTWICNSFQNGFLMLLKFGTFLPRKFLLGKMMDTEKYDVN